MTKDSEKEREYIAEIGGVAAFILLSLLAIPIFNYFDVEEASEAQQAKVEERVALAEEKLNGGFLHVAKREVESSFNLAKKRTCSDELEDRRNLVKENIDQALAAKKKLDARICENLDALDALKKLSPETAKVYEPLAAGCSEN